MRARPIFAAPLMLLAACGGSPTQPNRPPTVSMQVSPSDTGVIAAATSMGFTATGADPDNDVVTYEWDFGDGATASGPATQHVFPSVGRFTVTLRARDTTGAMVAVQREVTAKSLAGVWVMQNGRWFFELSQTGSTIGGRVLGQGDGRYSAVFPLSGRIDQPNHVTFLVDNFPRLGFSGTPDPSVDRIIGQAEYVQPYPDILLRVP